jgi:hypothetical protein
VNTHIVVPALTIRTPEGSLDRQGTAQYARRAADTWTDRFILSGTTARGYSLTEQERLCVLRVWLDHTDPARLLACCWSRADVDNATTQRVTPLVVIPHLHNDDAALRFLASLPAGSFVYSHPGNSPTVFDAQLCSKARSSDCLPVGAKLSKVSCREIAAVRAQAGFLFHPLGWLIARYCGEYRGRGHRGRGHTAEPLRAAVPPAQPCATSTRSRRGAGTPRPAPLPRSPEQSSVCTGCVLLRPRSHSGLGVLSSLSLASSVAMQRAWWARPGRGWRR